MNEQAGQALELPGVIALLKRRLASSLGAARLERFSRSPLAASSEVAALAIAEAGEAMDWLRAAEARERRDLVPPPRLEGLADLAAPVERLVVEDSVLEAGEIHDLLTALDRAVETRARLQRHRAQAPLLGAHADRFADFSPLLSELGGKILPNGKLADHASSALARIRRQIEQQRAAVQRTLEQFVRRRFAEGVLQDDYATIRGGRSVVPVKASWKGRVDGVIHASSGSGRTVFIEPLETIVENNRLVELLEEEQREIRRILSEMTARLRLEGDAVREAVSALADLELIFCKARFGREFRCCLPRFSAPGEPRIKLDWARHPLLEDVLKRDGAKVEPLALKLDGPRRALIVSGPNAGGKTVVLKTVGLLSLMAQCGLPVPAAEAEFPWFERTLADIGDAQSIEASLSTFSAHVGALTAMMEQATGASLVILDELGSATDPHEGGALGVAVVERFLQTGAFTLVSTHLPALKMLAVNNPGVLSAAMGFDEKTLSPTHRMIVGVPGHSAGLAMAERLGMPADVIRRAREAFSERGEQAEIYLAELRRRLEEREAAERELRLAGQRFSEKEREFERRGEQREKTLRAEFEQRFEKALRKAESAQREILADALERIEAASDTRRAEMQAQRAASRAQRKTSEAYRQAASEELGAGASEAAQSSTVEIREGATVRLGGLGATGRVARRLGGGRWEIEVGSLRMQVAAEDITEVLEDQPSEGAKLPSGVTFRAASKPAVSLTEINVIGKRVDEALPEVDKFLDNAVLAEASRLRVIHGHGTNALRRALWKMFAGHPQVAKHYQAEQQEGGAGATIVELKE